MGVAYARAAWWSSDGSAQIGSYGRVLPELPMTQRYELNGERAGQNLLDLAGYAGLQPASPAAGSAELPAAGVLPWGRVRPQCPLPGRSMAALRLITSRRPAANTPVVTCGYTNKANAEPSARLA